MVVAVARVRLLLACIVAGAAGTAWAEVVPWLYDVDVAVGTQSDADRRRAAGAAFTEVLSRVTGLREIPFSPEVDGAIRESEGYYVRYGFATRDIPPDDDGDAVTETRLKVHFEPNTLLELLRDTGLPVWSADRPTVLAWVVLERDRHLSRGAPGAGPSRTRAPEVVSAAPVGMAEQVALAMHREARRRGVMLTFPLMDLEDRGLRVTDLWGRFWTAILQASERYSRDLTLLGRIASDPGGGWTSRWEVMSPNGEEELAETFDHRGMSADAAAGEAVHRLADALARRFAVRGGDLDSIAVTVRGAQTVRAYAAVMAYLESREYITRVEVAAVEPDALYLRLHSRSARDQLVELLLMGGYLSPSRTASPTPPLAAPRLELTWMGAR